MGWVGWDVNVHAHVMLMMLRCSWGGVGWGGMLAFMFMLRWWRFVDHGVWWGGIFSIRLMLRWNCSMVEVVFEKCKNRRARLHAQCWEVHATPLKTTRRLSAPFPSSCQFFHQTFDCSAPLGFLLWSPKVFLEMDSPWASPTNVKIAQRERDYIYITLYIYTAHIYIYTVYI